MMGVFDIWGATLRSRALAVGVSAASMPGTVAHLLDGFLP
jgi:hypothetical protein